jgi:hypothetical protein
MKFKTFLERPEIDNNYFKAMTPAIDKVPINYNITKSFKKEIFKTIDFAFPKIDFHIIPVKLLQDNEEEPDDNELKQLTINDVTNSNFNFYIANNKGKNIGQLMGFFRPNGYFQIGSISIDPLYRGKNIAFNLYKTLMANFKGILSDTAFTKTDKGGSYYIWKQLIEDPTVNAYPVVRYTNNYNIQNVEPIKNIDDFISEYGDENYNKNSEIMFLAIYVGN